MAELIKKALIVGATGGMGSAVATMLAENGVHCALVGRNKQKLENIFSVCSSFGNSAFTFSCDISDSSEIKKCCQEVVNCLSPVELCQYILAKGVRKHGSEALF